MRFRLFFFSVLILFCVCNMQAQSQALDTAYIEKLLYRSEAFAEQNPDSCEYYARKALRLASEQDHKRLIAWSYECLGDVFFYKASADSSDYYFQKAIHLYDSLGRVSDKLDVMNGIGSNAYSRGNYDQALDYFINILEDIEANNIQNVAMEGIVLANIAQIYQNLKQYDLSDQYSYEAIELFETTDNEGGMAVAYANIAFNSVEERDYNEAIELSKKAHALFKKNNNEYGIGATVYLLGKCYSALGDLDKAQNHLTRSIDLITAFGNNHLMTLNHLELGRLYFKQEKWNAALAHLNKASQLSENHDLKPEQSDAYLELSKIYEIQNNHAVALRFFKKHKYLADSLLNEKKAEQLQTLETRYQTAKKEQRIALQEESLARQQAQISRQVILRNALIGGVVLFLAIAGLVYRNAKIHRKSLREKEALLKEIHHRVKNNLQVISSILNMQSRGTENEDMLEAIKEGQSRVKAMSLIHQQLYQTENLSEINIQEYITELNSQLATLYQNKDRKVKNRINASDLKLDIDTAIPLGLILNELISNAYKYAFQEVEKGLLLIELKRIDKEKLRLEVVDNGSGLPANFELEKAKSLGLKLVNILTKQLKGSMTYTKEGGSRFQIEFNDLGWAN